MKETIKVHEDSKVRIGAEELTETTANNEVKSKYSCDSCGSCGKSFEKTPETKHYPIEMSWEEARKWIDGKTGGYLAFSESSFSITPHRYKVKMTMTENILVLEGASFRLEFDRRHRNLILFYGIYKELGYLLSFRYCNNSELNVVINH